MTSEIKQRLTDDMKSAMKAGDKSRLGTIRMALAAIKQREVDSREEQDDAAVLATLEKMVKQRRDSLSQFEAADRQDLAAIEKAELAVLADYLPQPLSDAEIAALIETAIDASGAQSMRDMGAVMAQLNPQLAGRADMKQVSAQVKDRLSG